jgi:hypothetical protein
VAADEGHERETTMLTRMTYNCTPDGLADVSQEAFVDALENEFAAAPLLRNCSLTVTFDLAHRSSVTSVAVTDGDSNDPADYEELARGLAEKAFNACCTAG